MCRYESNGKALEIVYSDGVARPYLYVVYLDVDCRDFKVGDIVQLYEDKERTRLVCERKVEGFRRGQLNAKLWV